MVGQRLHEGATQGVANHLGLGDPAPACLHPRARFTSSGRYRWSSCHRRYRRWHPRGRFSPRREAGDQARSCQGLRTSHVRLSGRPPATCSLGRRSPGVRNPDRAGGAGARGSVPQRGGEAPARSSLAARGDAAEAVEHLVDRAVHPMRLLSEGVQLVDETLAGDDLDRPRHTQGAQFSSRSRWHEEAVCRQVTPASRTGCPTAASARSTKPVSPASHRPSTTGAAVRHTPPVRARRMFVTPARSAGRRRRVGCPGGGERADLRRHRWGPRRARRSPRRAGRPATAGGAGRPSGSPD